MRFFALAIGLQLCLGLAVSSAFAQEAEVERAPAATGPQSPRGPQTPPPQGVRRKSGVIVAPTNEDVVEENSSAYHRIDKQWMLDAMLFGVGPSISATWGLEGGYYLSRNSLVLLQLTGGSLNSSATASLAGSQSGSSTDLKTSSIGLHYKHFAGNSFYWRGGADLRSADYSYTYTSGTSDYYKFKGTSLALNFQIGNQWQWSYFTLGCDWIGVSVPLTSSVSDEQLSTTAPSYYASWRNSDEDYLVRKTHLNLLRFYLGASF